MTQAFARIAVRIPFRSGLPRDVSINVFHLLFDSETADLVVAFGAIVDFYNGSGGDDRNHPLAYYYSLFCDRSTAACSGHLSVAPPNTVNPTWDEFGNEPWTLGGTTATVDLPQEACCVASWHGTAPAVGGAFTLPARSKRGRTYLGPLNNQVLGSSSDGRAIMTNGFLDDVKGASKHLVDQLATNGTPLIVYSSKTGHGSLVDRGFVNNEMDTQRRRGVGETVRRTWTTV